MKMTDEKKIYRILSDAFDKGLIEPSKMSPDELGRAIREELETNPPTFVERMRACIYTIRLKLNRKK